MSPPPKSKAPFDSNGPEYLNVISKQSNQEGLELYYTQDLWTITGCTGRSVHVWCVREERAERSKKVVEGETVFP